MCTVCSNNIEECQHDNALALLVFCPPAVQFIHLKNGIKTYCYVKLDPDCLYTFASSKYVCILSPLVRGYIPLALGLSTS